MKRVLVTGASGFIGSRLVQRLRAEHWDVHVLVRSTSNLAPEQCAGVTVHVHDGSTEGLIDLVRNARPQMVMHLASLFLPQHNPADVTQLIASNVLFSAQLVEAMHVNGVQYLINTGTSWQHYEDRAAAPVNLYAATKQAFEDVLAYYIDACGLKVTSLVLFDTYGPNDPRRKLVALLWDAAINAKQLSMSPGEQLIDIVHIDDVVDAYVRAAELLPRQEAGHCRYGVSSGRPVPLKDLVVEFENAVGMKVPVEWGGRPYRPREVMKPWTTFDTLPGWQPRIPFAQGIRQTRPA